MDQQHEDIDTDDEDSDGDASESVPIHDMLFIIGDLNAKVGSDNTCREHVMGKHGIGTINDNGERLADFCEENNLLIGATLFQHKDIHKATWTSSDGITKNQRGHGEIQKIDGRSGTKKSQSTV
ncbi:hypothetical protein C0Q70_14868 [Pomacea canaliculata]|uniref:Endonuclease/exonuclease/phosphatase domain-containing protein n=1 Tax=Pomacea canaliculata TaxID=400727 RepID=A0A2T7NTC0_POMCA|nr:hypothetical protein C0Q70_14868 [Pomacea canaliculata]